MRKWFILGLVLGILFDIGYAAVGMHTPVQAVDIGTMVLAPLFTIGLSIGMGSILEVGAKMGAW